MASFGENLRREREARGISLEEISKTTKISVRLLQAIENEEFDRLPGGVFNINFVRQYARQVGIDEEKVISEFRWLTVLPAETATMPREGGPAPERTKSAPEDWDRPRQSGSRVATVVAAVVVAGLAAGGYLWVRVWRPAGQHQGPAGASVAPSSGATPATATGPAPERVPPPAEAAPPAAAASGSPQPPPEPAAPAPEPEARLRVEIQTTGRVWVSASADGKRQFEAVMPAQGTRLVTAQSRVWLRVGDAAAVTLRLNGQTQPPLGPSGQVRTVVLTAAGMEILEPLEPQQPPSEPKKVEKESP